MSATIHEAHAAMQLETLRHQERIAGMTTKELMLDAQRIRGIRLQLVQTLAAIDRKALSAPPASILDVPERGLIDGGLAG